jgi:hypothetical protein
LWDKEDRKMKNFIICAVISIFCSAAVAVDYNDFPADLQLILNERTAELESKGGVCVAGRVTLSDGAYISSDADVMVNLNCSVDEPLDVFKGGWFIAKEVLPPSYTSWYGRGLVVRAFGYDPLDASIRIQPDEITYLECVLEKTPAEKLSSVEGIVVDDHNEPVDGATVSISFPFVNLGMFDSPYRSMVTGPDGQYHFEGLSKTEHRISASASGHAVDSASIVPLPGEIQIVDLKLFPKLKIVMDYIYQADGSDDFTGGDLESSSIEWAAGSLGLDFSDRGLKDYNGQSLRDLELRQEQGVLKFYVTFCNGRKGFCDLGAVDFGSVTAAPQAGYQTRDVPCIVGHVYVVRTYEDNYAKFVVRSISEAR